MSTRRQLRQQRLERKTARVFFSSPFGGLEEEREELTKKYWPQLESLCNKAGYEFIPVDLRWGITSEMSSSAVTIRVCMSEMDRSDMIVGFFGQRYGWHGDNELLQKSFDVAAEKYEWLNEYRDRSVTELEYLHGHLRDPGARAACFFFRDKAYDDMKLEEAIEGGDERQIRKFRASTDGPNASKFLDDLKKRIENTKDKCLAVYPKYRTPQEGARLMFDTIQKHLQDVLLAAPAESLTPEDIENIQHDVFLASKRGMGGSYVGGAKYLEMIDKHLAQTAQGSNKPLLVLGNAGSGKSCLLSNWITNHQENNPADIVIYHFVGSSSESTVPASILARLAGELFQEIKEFQENNNTQTEKSIGSMDELRPRVDEGEKNLARKLRALTEVIKDAGPRVLIAIDALNKVDVEGQTTKTLYWLPKSLPSNVHLLLSTLNTDTTNIQELEGRGCEKIEVLPLQHEEREEIALATLKIRGKTLSTEQRERIFKKEQTENALYLKTHLQELLSFGEFFQLDAYIDNLLQANNTKELFLKFLERLEQDYNPEEFEGNLIEQIMSCILVSRQGLSESEIKSLLHITDQMWSAVFFAVDDFLIVRSGLYNFAYDELAEAVEEKYCHDKEKRNEFTLKVSEYFEEKMKDINPIFDSVIPQRVLSEVPWLLRKYGDQERLEKFILKPTVSWGILCRDQGEYELGSYLRATGLSGEEIVTKQQKQVDDQLTLCYNHSVERGEDRKNVQQKIIRLLTVMTHFLEKAGYTKFVEPLYERLLQMQKAQSGEDKIQEDPEAAKAYFEIANNLACVYTSTEQFQKAEDLHQEILYLKEKFVDSIEDGISSLAVTFCNLGALYYGQGKHKEAGDFYKRALEKHREAKSGRRDIAEILNNLGTTCWALGDYVEAVPYLEESLELYEEEFFGELPPDVGGTMMNLGMVYRRMDGMEEKAAALYERALEIRENAYGPNHPEVAQTLLSMSALKLYSDTEAVLELAKRAARIYEESLGLNHINTLNALENIALAYLVLQKPAEAHPYFKQAGVQKALLGRMDTSIPKVNAVMVDYYLNTGQNEEARELLGRLVGTSFASDRDFAALDYLDKELPKEKRPARPYEESVEYAITKFPKSPMIFGRLQEKYSANGDSTSMVAILDKGEFSVEQYNAAYQGFNDAGHKKEGMEILLAAHSKYPNDKVIMFNLGSAYASYKDHKAASNILKKLLEVDPDDLDSLELYARMLCLSGRLHEGKEVYAQAVKIAEQKDNKEMLDKLNAAVKLMNEM